jgi:hypothetical protein
MSQLAGDLAHIAIAFVLLVPIVWMPGFALGWALDLLEFRSRTPLWRMILALPLSIASAPALVFFAWRLISYRAVAGLYVIFLLGAVAAGWAQRRELLAIRIPRAVFAIFAIWAVICVGSLADLPWHGGIYVPMSSVDHALRTEWAASAARAYQLPPLNPFYVSRGQTAPLKYHYFGVMICGAVERIAPSIIGARDAMFAFMVWAGLGIISIVGALGHFYCPGKRSRRRTLIGIGLIPLGGLIGLALLYDSFRRLSLHDTRFLTYQPFNNEHWWNFGGCDLLRSSMWAPHHVGSLIAVMVGLLLLMDSVRSPRTARAIVNAVAAGVALASATGLAVHPALVGCGIVALAAIPQVVRMDFRALRAIFITGGTTLAVSFMFLFDLMKGSSGEGYLQLAVRSTPLSQSLEALWKVPAGLGATLVNLLLLAPTLVVEFGFPVMVFVWVLRRSGDDAEDATARSAMAAVFFGSLALSSIISSKTNHYPVNDMAMRGCLLAQVVGLLWIAQFVDEKLPERARLRDLRFLGAIPIALIGIGLLSTAILLTLDRVENFAVDAGLAEPSVQFVDTNSGVRLASVRAAGEWIRKNLPRDAVVQDNPIYRSLGPGLYFERQSAAMAGLLGLLGGGELRGCVDTLDTSVPLFNSAGTDYDLAATCRHIGIDFLAAQSHDRAWKNPDSWVWREKPVFANPDVRVFDCRSNATRPGADSAPQ